MNKLIEWFAGNHVAANLLMLFFVLAGIVSALTIKLEIFPEFTLETITVSVEYRGASPSEVEEGILRQIEDKVAGLAGIRRIDSVAREGVGVVTIEVMSGWDVQKLLDEVKSEVDRLTNLPEQAEQPIVRQITRRSMVLWLAIYGDAPESTLKHLAQKARDDLTNQPGITVAELFGVREGEIHIEISEHTLRRYGLTLNQVAEKVGRSSLDLPAGSVKTAGGEILVRAKGKKYRAAEYRDVPIVTRNDGSTVTLGQIARLIDGYRDDLDLKARFNNKPAALIQVFRVADQNALTVAAETKAYAEELARDLPHGVHVDFFGDRSRVLKDRMNLLLRNMFMGLVLVIITLGLFLNARLAFWVTLGIPISFLASLWFLPMADVSINMISLFAFIMVLGIVVDDAIVVGEHVFYLREKGFPPLKAAVEGTTAIGSPVIFSVLTTVAAFAPLLLAGGTMGKIMKNIPTVVILVLLASLVECLLILPSHLSGSKFRPPKESGKKEKITARWLTNFVHGPYRRLLDLCLRWRYATVAAGLALLLAAVGLVAGGYIKFTLFPKVEGDVLTVNLTMPAGTPLERTENAVAFLEKTVREVLADEDAKRPAGAPPLLKSSIALLGLQSGQGHGAATSGDSGGHVAQMFVEILPGEERDVSSGKLVNEWRKRVGQIPDAENISFSGELFSTSNPIEVHLSAPNEDQLKLAAQELKDRLNSYAGVFDVSDSFLPGKMEMQLELKPTARALGLTLADLANQVRAAFYGAEALRLQRDQDEVRVLVRYPEKERQSLGRVEDMRIRTPGGDEVPFSQVAQVHMTQGYTSIDRAQRRRVMKVFADVDPTVANSNEVRRWLTTTVLPEVARNHPDLRYTMEGEGRDEQESLRDVGEGFVLALFMIYALLAIPFRSFSQPLIVMSAIPFGVVGALFGHLIMGLDASLLSLFGVVGLAGVVVNDSLVLIHAANAIQVNENLSPDQAIREAGPLRFRAIILTSVTTFAGLIPIITERSLQAQFLIPMAVSLGFGVLFATGITLILVPAGYLILYDIHNLGTRIKARLFPGSARAEEHHSS
ncbi:MAG: efflux RND transporter permease subunit [Deltaproteobacteria bacterium]|nr:efflux RND transporter permease subunit [Deltaproteobacteria bacterium]